MGGAEPVVLLLHQVIAGPERDQVGVVGRSRNGDGPGAADVRVAHLIGQDLQLVGTESVVVPQHVVMGRPAGALPTTPHTGKPQSGPADISGLHSVSTSRPEPPQPAGQELHTPDSITQMHHMIYDTARSAANTERQKNHT